MTRAVEELARRLSQAERNIRTIGSTPQLAYSSIEDGNVTEYDIDGNLVQIIGQQFDGTSTTAQFNGPTPSTPTQAILTARVGGYGVRWDGAFVDGSVPAMDFLRVDVHASAADSGFTPGPSNRVGSIVAATGGTITVSGATGLTYYVKLVVVSQSGKLSDPSTVASVVPLSPTTDGVPPSASPGAPTVLGGVGVLLVRWTPLTNQSTVKYNVYVSDNPSFLADGSTLVATTEGTQFTVRQLTGGIALAYGTTYYVKVWAQDADGLAPGPSAAGSGMMYQATTVDIAADYVYAGSVIADQIIGGSLAAEVTLSGLIRTALAGQRVEVGPFGVIIYDSAGNPRTVLAPDSSTFRGDAELEGLTVNGTASIRTLLEIAKGASVSLQSATSAPPSAPSVVTYYPAMNLATGGWWVNGFHFYGSKYWVAKDLAGGPRLSSYATSNGANVDNLDLGNPTTDIRPRPWGGCVHLGSSWYTIGWQTDATGAKLWYLTKYDDATGATQAQTTISVIGTGFASTSAGTIAIGTDGTNILQAEFDDANDRYRIFVRNPTTLAVSSTVNTGANSGFTGPVVSVGKTNADFGGSRWYVASKAGAHVYVFDGTTNAYIPNEAFRVPNGPGAQGALWDGTRFLTRSQGSDTAQAVLYSHSTYTWNTSGSDLTYGAATTWRNVTSSYETPKGPVRSFTYTKRSWIQITTAAIPANAEEPGFYLSSNPAGANTTFRRQLSGGTGVTTTALGDGINVTSGTNPPTTSTFPNETAAKIVSQATFSVDSSPVVDLRGDGTGRLALPVRTGWHLALGSDSATFTGTTYANTGLYVPTDAGGVYEIEGELFCTSNNSAGNMKLKWAYPSAGSWTGWFTGQALGVGAPGAMAADIRVQARGASGFEAILGSPGNGSDFLVRFKVRMANTGSAGNINLQCCQQTAGAGGPQLRTPSWLTATRVG